MTDAVEQIKRLLAAERAGVEALSRLVDGALTSEMRTCFNQIRADEARACAGLVGCLARLGRRRRGLKEIWPRRCWRSPRSRIASTVSAMCKSIEDPMNRVKEKWHDHAKPERHR